MDFRSLLIFALAFIVTVKVAEGATANACYGTDPTCDFYSIQCASTEVIRLNNLYAGYKNSSIYPVCASADHCQSSSSCCSYTGVSGDFLEFFNLENIYNTYRNCSGRQSCTEIHAPWQLMQTVVSVFSTYSSYVQVEYDCQDATDIIPLCGGPTGTITRDKSYAEIMFDGSIEKYDLTKASRECQCTITNLGKQQNVAFTTIDVRLESYYRQENQTSAECSSAFLRSDVIAAQCVVSDQHHKANFHRSNRQLTIVMPTGTTSEISLTNIHENGVYDSPAMVWLSLRAEPNNGVRVTCKEVVSAETTTSSTSTTTTSTTTTTTTPMPTTTITTTTHKPTTTTPKPTTTTPKPTTSTPKPTTTTPKPTTTTPKPTTTTPKPTTTITTPKPTTTTPKPTTTTPKPTTTTPKPTTTTPKPTTTTPKPTTTITTPKPTTTTTTIKPTSKSMAVTTITTSTSKPTTSSTTKTTALPTTLKPPVTWRTTAKPPDTTLQPRETTTNKEGVVPNTGDGENDRQQRIAVYLAICIPIIVCIFIITVLLLWIYWKRTSRRKDKFRFMKGTPRSKVYHTLSNPKILDDFIQQVGIDPSTPREKPMINSYVSVPELRPRSILSNGSTYRQQQQPPPEPYVIPVNVRKSEPLYSTPIKQPAQNVVHVRLSRDNDYDKTPVIITDTLEPEVKLVKDEDERDEPSQRKSELRKKPDDADGSIVIHVDNLSLPPLSARSTNPATSSLNTSSTRSEFGSTPGDLTPERRNSEPALITTDSIVDRRSASAYVLPGTSPDDSTVLFVK